MEGINNADDEKGHNHSTCEEEEYESEFGDGSDTSISSGLDDDDHPEASVPCSKLAVTDVMILQEDESLDTGWTDDKHSSYLDTMEATFVRRMYDKEYCSIDVCGHSSHSSISAEQDCVESHPLYINVRKPEEKAIGLLPLRAFTGPWFSTSSSVLTSPWIQHFKSKQTLIAKSTKALDNSDRAEQNNSFLSKKGETFFDTAECKPSPRISHGTVGGGFKKLKCQQTLSHIDMMMEEQYNAEQRIQPSDQEDEDKAPSKAPSDKIEELTKQVTGFFEAESMKKAMKRKEGPELSLSKDKQSKALNDPVKPISLLDEELTLKKSDQLVPPYKDDATETCGQSVVPDMTLSSKQEVSKINIEVDKKDGLLHCSEHEKVTTGQSGSKTWTWDTRGRRYRLGEKMMSANIRI